MKTLSTQKHPRESNLGDWIYPVKSRRSGGLSLGLNLNPNKRCTFDCPYCQVDRQIPNSQADPPLDQLVDEVTSFLSQYQQQGDFAGLTLQDIALAGDGEPTLYADLPQLLVKLVEIKKTYQTPEKLILFTNGSHLNRPDLTPCWPGFYAAAGEVWFKLDFWDQASFLRANGKQNRHTQILENLLHFGRLFPVTLQSCFFTDPSTPPDFDFVQPWSDQLCSLIKQGLKLHKIQVYTLARAPKDSSLRPYDDPSMEQIGEQIRHLTQQTVEIYYSH